MSIGYEASLRITKVYALSQHLTDAISPQLIYEATSTGAQNHELDLSRTLY